MSCNNPGWGRAKPRALLAGCEHSQRASQASALPGPLSSSFTSGSRCGRRQRDGSSKRQPTERAHGGSSTGRPWLADPLPRLQRSAAASAQHAALMGQVQLAGRLRALPTSCVWQRRRWEAWEIKGCEVWRQLLAPSLACCSCLLPRGKPGCAGRRCVWFGGNGSLRCLCAQEPAHTRGKGLGIGKGGNGRTWAVDQGGGWCPSEEELRSCSLAPLLPRSGWEGRCKVEVARSSRDLDIEPISILEVQNTQKRFRNLSQRPACYLNDILWS